MAWPWSKRRGCETWTELWVLSLGICGAPVACVCHPCLVHKAVTGWELASWASACPGAVTPLEKGVLPAGLRRDWPRRSGHLSAGGRPATGLFGAGGCPSGRVEQLVAEVTSWRAVVEGPGRMERGPLHPVSPLSCPSLEGKLKSWSSGRLRALRCAGSLLTRGNSSG